MSLIGPRPERPAFCAEFEKRIHGWHYRTMVTPGLSGLAQVTGGYDLLPKEKVVLDLWRCFHDPADDLLRHGNLLGFKGGVHPAVPVASIAAVEHLRYADAQGGMLVWP